MAQIDDALVLVLAPRLDGLDLAVRLRMLDGGFEVGAHVIHQLRAIEHMRHHQQRGVGDLGIVDGAALRIDGVLIDIHALGEPFVDPGMVAVVARHMGDARQRRAQLPAMVGRVNAAFGEAGSRLGHDRPYGFGHIGAALMIVGFEDRDHQAEILDQEAGIGRRMAVADAEGAVRVLNLGQPGQHLVDMRKQRFVVMVARLFPDEGRHQPARLAGEPARRAGQRRGLAVYRALHLAVGGPGQDFEAGVVRFRGAGGGDEAGGNG
jgi:hypothetical protein